MSTTFRFTRLAALVPALLAISASAFATDLSNQKLFGKWSLTPGSYLLGEQRSSAALSPKWIVIGAEQAAEHGLPQ
jgi:hypothetical protein